jgi:hypothetical protein
VVACDGWCNDTRCGWILTNGLWI